MKNAIIGLAVMFLLGCAKKPERTHIKGVYRPSVVVDPEIVMMEKILSRDFTGLIPEYYDRDSTRLNCLTEVRNGEVKSRWFFSPARHLEEEVHYDCSALHGTQKRYYPNGQVKERLDMEHGVRHGYHIRYSPEGKIMASERWKSGKPAGPIRVYDSAGQFTHYVNRMYYDSIFGRQ